MARGSDLFERQFHILIFIIVIDIIAKIVHGQKINNSNFVVKAVMLKKMGDELGQLKYF